MLTAFAPPITRAPLLVCDVRTDGGYGPSGCCGLTGGQAADRPRSGGDEQPHVPDEGKQGGGGGYCVRTGRRKVPHARRQLETNWWELDSFQRRIMLGTSQEWIVGPGSVFQTAEMMHILAPPLRCGQSVATNGGSTLTRVESREISRVTGTSPNPTRRAQGMVICSCKRLATDAMPGLLSCNSATG